MPPYIKGSPGGADRSGFGGQEAMKWELYQGPNNGGWSACFELAVMPAFLAADRSSSVAVSGSSGTVGSGSAWVSGGAAALGAGLVSPWIPDVQRTT